MNLTVTYPIHHILPSAKSQAAASADRPICALTSAFAAFRSGKQMLGTWSQLTNNDTSASFSNAYCKSDIPVYRAERWADGVNAVRLPKLRAYPINGMVPEPYQVAAAEYMTVAGGTLALGCGLGKTLTAVMTAIHATEGGFAARERCWIVCPINAYSAWRRWLPALRTVFAEVEIVSMDILHKLHPERATGGVVIFDEAHMLGSMSARRTKNAHRIRQAFDFGLCLTGTLLHGGVEKSLSILDLAVPGAALFGNRWNAGEYFRCLVRKTLGNRTVTELARPVGIARERFMEWLTRTCISLNKHSDLVTQSLVLPEQDLKTVQLGEPWTDLDDLVAQIVEARVANGDPLPHAQEVAHLLARDGIAAKVGWLMEEMERQPGEPVVVFAQYHETLGEIESALVEAGITYVRVDGSVTGQDRIEAQAVFQAGNAQVFLGQMEASGVAIDLFRAKWSVAFDLSWKAAAYNQALARTCRRGQANRCLHVDLVTNHLQANVVERLRASEDFDASTAAYMALKGLVKTPT